MVNQATTPPVSPDAIVDRYFESWNAASPQRAALLARTFSPQAYYCDGMYEAAGRAAIADMMDSVMAQQPGAKFMLTSKVDTHHQQARFAWKMEAADGTQIVDGIDAIRFDAEGAITAALGFFGVDIPTQSGGATEHTFEWQREYPVTAARLFAIVSDNEIYAKVAPNLANSHIVEGEREGGRPGPGTVRQCTNPQGASWTEVFTEWVEGHRFSLRVDVDTYPPDLRAMIDALEASWEVHEVSERSSRVVFRIRTTLTDLGVKVLRDGGGANALVEPILEGWSEYTREEA